MPLVKIHLSEGRSNKDKDGIAAGVQAALVDVLGVPDADRYQLLVEHPKGNFRHTDGYLGLSYSDRLVIVEITVVEGRDDDRKKALLEAINRELAAADLVGPDDVFVMIYEISRSGLSFGRGLAQRAP